MRADERVDRVAVDEVGRHRERAPAVGLDLRLHLGEVVGVARREHDRGALAGECARVRLPEPRADARDDRYLAVEQHPTPRHARVRTVPSAATNVSRTSGSKCSSGSVS